MICSMKKLALLSGTVLLMGIVNMDAAAMPDLNEAKVTLGDYKNIDVPAPFAAISESEVDAQIRTLLKWRNILDIREVTKEVTDRAARNGDTVLIDFVCWNNGKRIDELDAQDIYLELGSSWYFDGFGEQLIDAHKGDNVRVSIIIPKEDTVEGIEQQLDFEVTIHEIREMYEVPLTEELLSGKLVDQTLAELREEVRQDLKRSADRKAKDELPDLVMATIIERSIFSDIDPAVEAEYQRALIYINEELAESGQTLMEYAKYFRFEAEDEAAFYDELMVGCRNMVKEMLVVEAIAEAENIKINDQDRIDMIGADSMAEFIEEHGIEWIDYLVKEERVYDLLMENTILR